MNSGGGHLRVEHGQKWNANEWWFLSKRNTFNVLYLSHSSMRALQQLQQTDIRMSFVVGSPPKTKWNIIERSEMKQDNNNNNNSKSTTHIYPQINWIICLCAMNASSSSYSSSFFLMFAINILAYDGSWYYGFPSIPIRLQLSSSQALSIPSSEYFFLRHHPPMRLRNTAPNMYHLTMCVL